MKDSLTETFPTSRGQVLAGSLQQGSGREGAAAGPMQPDTSCSGTRMPAHEDAAVLVIEPSTGWRALGLGELWAHRELIAFFIWRDVKLRYTQTVLGVSWTVIQPFLTMVVFSIFFGQLAGMSSDGVPYPVFSFAALVPWSYFASGLTKAATSVVNHQSLLTKIYLPRMVLPIAGVLSGILDLGIALLVLLAMLVFFGIMPTASALWLIPLSALATAAALGTGLCLAALNVRYRDVQHTLPFLVQLWLFATPIAYSSSIVPAPWRTLLGVNPMAGVVEGVRWALLRTGPAPLGMISISTLVSLALLTGGAFVFRRMERSFADVV